MIKRIIRSLAVTALMVLALALPVFAQEEQTCYDRNGDGTYRCDGELFIPLNEAYDFNNEYPPFVYGDEDNEYPPYYTGDEFYDEEYYDEEYYEDLQEAEEEYREALEEIYENYNLEWYSY